MCARVLVTIQENERACICVLGVSMLPLFPPFFFLYCFLELL